MGPGNKRRSRRLRKKIHVGEFRELGFRFEAELKDGLSPEQVDALADALLDEVIEPRRLALGGWADGGFVAYFGRGSATDEDRHALESWMRQRAEYASVTVGPLLDAWYC